jgi:hypothetical protein
MSEVFIVTTTIRTKDGRHVGMVESENAQQADTWSQSLHETHLGRGASPAEHDLELLKMRVEQLEKQLAQNAIGSHPDTRPAPPDDRSGSIHENQP